MDQLLNDFSPEAQKLRLVIFWKKRNWFGVMDILEPQKDIWLQEGRVDLSKDELKKVLHLSIAYRMQEEFSKLKKMKEMLTEKIINPEIKHIFAFVTDQSKKLNFQDFSNTVELNEIEDFLIDYSFWPGKDWKNIEQALEPKIEKLKMKVDILTDDDRAEVVRLALAYAMQMGDIQTPEEKVAKKKLSDLQRDFKNVTINKTTIRILSILDKKFEPKIDDTIFTGKIGLKDLPEFIKIYTSANKFSEINSAIQ